MTPENQALIDRVRERIKIRRKIRSADDRISNEFEALIRTIEELNRECDTLVDFSCGCIHSR